MEEVFFNTRLPKLLILFVLLFFVSDSNGSYVVTTPRRWTSGQASQVCVILSSGAASDDALSIRIVTETFAADKDRVVDPILEPKKLVLPEGERNVCNKVLLPDTKESRGKLILEGALQGATFNESRDITIVRDVAETFVQTDKYLYKPQQTVQFRILTVIGPYLNISLEQYDEIWIENPSGTRITQWLNVPNENGLIHMSFTLSDEPEEGDYKIRVRTPFGPISTKSFKVEEYVLPRYEVVIEPPTYILGTSETFDFEVCAKYTFGQPVKGNVTLTVDNNSWGNYKIIVRKNSKISGCAKFTLNSTELSINGDGYFSHALKANANVTEEGTGVELKAEMVSVDITRTALDFEDISTQQFYKPEVPYVGEIEVTKPDDSLAPNEPMNVCCQGICKNLTTNSNGILKFAIPPHLRERIRIRSLNYPHIKSNNSYRSIMYESSYSKSLKRYYSKSNSSLVIAVSSDEVECSSTKESIDLQLPVYFAAVGQSSADVTVQVISRGQIQFSRTFEQSLSGGSGFQFDQSLLLEPLKEPETKNLTRGHFTVSMTLPKTTSPKAQVVVWYARKDGEVVSDARDLDITDCLLNAVNMTWSAEKGHPGDRATLSLQAEPFSLCSIGVVDKSVQLLSGKKNSLTVQSLLKLTQKSAVGEHEHLQVDDYEYCKDKFKDNVFTELPPLLPPVPLPMEPGRKRRSVSGETPSLGRKRRSLMIDHPWTLYSEDVDALHMFDEAGIYIFSDLTLEARPCKRRYDHVRYRRPFLYSPRRQYSPGPPGLPGPVAFPGRTPSFSMTRPGEMNSGGREAPRKKSRSYLPETWLWQIGSLPETGLREEELTLPDTVTEWVGSAVCVHPTKGVGLSPFSSITTFTDFFVDLTLPPTVKRGEIFPVKISVFNYLKEPLPLKVTLKESPEQYDILADVGEELGRGERSSCLPLEDKAVHSIRIRPKELGNVNLTVEAAIDTNAITTCGQKSHQVRTDTLVKAIKVELEGVEKERTWSKYICTEDLETNEDRFETWTIEAPKSIIPDSARGFVAVVGDLMGPTLEHLGSLVKMPYGCGEQNMLNFAPNIFVMQYLDSSNQTTEEVADKAIQYMKKGYQRELNYRHKDGSFSAFGERDDSGSTWLTAFVLKSFSQARDYIAVDSNDLMISIDWLKRKQLENGCFESVGRVLHKGMKGGLQNSDSPALLSSFVLIALMEAGENNASTTVRDALFCLAADDMAGNPYSLAVKAYALALAGSSDSRGILDNLLALATIEGSTMYWELPDKYGASRGIGVETAGYAILALLAQSKQLETDFPNVRKILKWINNQRNGQGGFVSTQDTIVALQALAQFEKAISQGPIDLHVIVEMTGPSEAVFVVNEQNKLLQQTADLHTIPTSVDFQVSGSGCVLTQAVLRYNIPEEEMSDAFSLRVNASTEPDSASCKTKRISACAAYRLPDKTSNMAIIEINLVSGYIPDKADLKRIVGYGTGFFKRYEIDGSVVTIYVDQFSSEELCLSFKIIREVDVENPKPGFVKVYDYYKPEYFTTMKYVLPPATECIQEEGNEFLSLELEKIIEVPTTIAPPPPLGDDLGEMLDAFDEAIP